MKAKCELEKMPFGHYSLKGFSKFIYLFVTSGVSRGFASKLIRKLLRRRVGKLVDINRFGLNFRLVPFHNATDLKILTSSKFYDGVEIRFLFSSGMCAKDRVFVDIGANTGYYSNLAANYGFKSIIAVEPNPNVLPYLFF